MNKEIQTPKNKLRSLGMRRSLLKGNAVKTPQSDAKIGYKSLQIQSDTEVPSPITPKLTQTPASTSCSTTRLPYRLSLSQKVREKYKKKKLEFASNQPANDVQEAPAPQQELTIPDKQQQKHLKHEEKVKELESLISVWSEAFKASLEELSSKIEPTMENEDLIARLGLPADMIDYT